VLEKETLELRESKSFITGKIPAGFLPQKEQKLSS
jgi:hypothetical protein